MNARCVAGGLLGTGLLWSGLVGAAGAPTLAVTTPTVALGKLVRGSTNTVFTVSSSGALSKTSGTGAVVGSTTVTPLVFSIACSSCGSNQIGSSHKFTFTVTTGTATGASGVTIGTYGYVSMTRATLSGSAPADADPLSVAFTSVTSWPVTITLDFTYTVDTSTTQGASTVPYTAAVTQNY